MTVKLRLAVAALLLFLVVMVDFTSRIMSVLADGVLVCGIVVLLWPVIKRNSLHNAWFFVCCLLKTLLHGESPCAEGRSATRYMG
ncbi:DUF3927 family protein [Escherichia coli]|nr:DUF3927 family protein [Escherichia coli]EIJ13072.1 hypothetical protein EC900105_5793 [Escherichia coli 900105 (10e)]